MEKTEKEFLFKKYKELYDELVDIDEKLSCQCRQEIQGFLDLKQFDDAKTYVHMFYHTKSAEDGNFDSIEKDLIYASINRLIREEKNVNMKKQIDTQEIIDNFTPIGVNRDSVGNVRILDEKSGMDFWVEVSVHNNDVITDWNQYIFIDNNSDDVMRKEIQDSIDVVMLAFECAVNYLLDNRCLYQSENGNWYESFEYWRNPTPAEIKAGQGAIHYLTLACSECLNKKGQPKKRLIYFRDRLTYYKK